MKTKYFFVVTLLTFFFVSCVESDDEANLPGSISGFVTDLATGKPIETAGVELMPKGQKTVTGTDGHFEFNDVEHGEYRLSVTKVGYQDFVTDEVSVEGGQSVSHSIQLEKLPQSLRIVNADAEDISDLVFSDDEDDVTRSFVIFNDGPVAIQWDIVSSAKWLSVSKLSDSLKPGRQYTIIVSVDRMLLNAGDNKTTIHVVSDNGSKDIKVVAKGTELIKTLLPTEITPSSAVLNGSIVKSAENIAEVGFVYGTMPTPTLDNKAQVVKHTQRHIGPYSVSIDDLESDGMYYVRAYAIDKDGVVYYGTTHRFLAEKMRYVVLESANLMVMSPAFPYSNEWETAKTTCESALIGGYSGWRLPTKEELALIYSVNYMVGLKAIGYWSSTKAYSNDYYYMDFSNGYIDNWTKRNRRYYFAVRTIEE